METSPAGCGPGEALREHFRKKYGRKNPNFGLHTIPRSFRNCRKVDVFLAAFTQKDGAEKGKMRGFIQDRRVLDREKRRERD